MKIYHLRFTASDFSKSGLRWRTPVVDLFYNSHYKNYSVKKHSNGTNLLGDRTYTGLNMLAATPQTTEIGFVENGRFIDTSGRVDIMDWRVTISNTSFDIPVKLGIFNADESSATPYYLHATPGMVNDWSKAENISPSFPINWINAQRYAFFELTFDSTQDISDISVELIIRIEIDPPVVNGYFEATKRLQNMFPEWMALREYDPTDEEKATPATPTSIGGQFFNAIAGEWLSDLNSLIQTFSYKYYINTADVDQKVWVYKTEGIPNIVYSVTGDAVQLSNTSGIPEFVLTSLTDDAFFWNSYTNELYTNKRYAELLINGTVYTQAPYRMWHPLDDIGASVDLFRIYLEENDSFRKRILDVYINQPGVTMSAFKNALRRELNLWRYMATPATPDSYLLGATPDVFDMEYLENDLDYVDDRGMPTRKFRNLILELSEKYPMLWGYIHYDEAFWDPDGSSHNSFQILPRQLDATPVDNSYLDSGVIDGNDLYVFKPDEPTGAIPFTAKLKLRGKKRTSRTEYPQLKFDILVYGRAAADTYDNPKITGNFTIELTISSATPTQKYYCNTSVSATSDISVTNHAATDAGRSLLEWTTPDGYTDAAYLFRDFYTGELYDGQIDLSLVSTVEIKAGHYDGNSATPSYDNVTTQSYYKAWFVETPGSILGSGGSTSLTLSNFAWATTHPALVFQSEVINLTAGISATPTSWVSQDQFRYTITLNGAAPDVTAQNYTLILPTIAWPSYTSNRQYVVQLVTTDGTDYGAYCDEFGSTPFLVPESYLEVEGNSVWSYHYLKTFSSATTTLTFSSASGASYPITGSSWALFEAEQTASFSGTVDFFGPWRNDQPSNPMNTDYLLTSLSLTRNSFTGIDNSIDYMVTWIGLSSVSDDRVSIWLESNSVYPAVYDGNPTNRAGALDTQFIESWNGSTYEFGQVSVYARIKPGANAQWNPKVHSGWFFDTDTDYYLYASPAIEYATTSTKTLSGVNRLGAPIIIQAMSGSTPVREMRRVSFWDDDATPTLTITNTETVTGNGNSTFYVSYNDIYDISVYNTTLSTPVSLSYTSTSGSSVHLTNSSNAEYTYTITYKVKGSYYADNQYTSGSGYNTRIVFDSTPSTYGASQYEITWEVSKYDVATPVDMPLNTLYTSIDEGFIYIDKDVYPLAQVEVKITPSRILADGTDYALVTFRSLDTNGNPKPYSVFNIYTNFGVLDRSSVTTDKDGFAWAILTSETWDGLLQPTPSTPALPVPTLGMGATPPQGTILVDGTVDVSLGFDIQIPKTDDHYIVAVVDSDFICADKSSATMVFGVVRDSQHSPVPYAVVYWRQARTVYELFIDSSLSSSTATPDTTHYAGRVIADANGRFNIGPFVSADVAGYWMVSVQSGSASPNMNANQFTVVGDVVYWYEYPNVTNMVNPTSTLPRSAIQASTPSSLLPQYSFHPKFPTTMDDNKLQPQAYGSNPIVWTPPRWYGIDKFKQYEMGVYGNQYDISGATPIYPEYKEF